MPCNTLSQLASDANQYAPQGNCPGRCPPVRTERPQRILTEYLHPERQHAQATCRAGCGCAAHCLASRAAHGGQAHGLWSRCQKVCLLLVCVRLVAQREGCAGSGSISGPRCWACPVFGAVHAPDLCAQHNTGLWCSAVACALWCCPKSGPLWQAPAEPGAWAGRCRTRLGRKRPEAQRPAPRARRGDRAVRAGIKVWCAVRQPGAGQCFSRRFLPGPATVLNRVLWAARH